MMNLQIDIDVVLPNGEHLCEGSRYTHDENNKWAMGGSKFSSIFLFKTGNDSFLRAKIPFLRIDDRSGNFCGFIY